MLGEQEQERWTKTCEDEEVIHWPSVIWIWITSSLSMVEGAGEVGREDEEVIHWPSAIWIQITSSLSMVEGAGEVGHEEI